MLYQNQFSSLLVLSAVLTLGACETINSPGYNSGYNNQYPQSNNSRQSYARYGVVKSVELVRQESNGTDIGLGTLAGAVVGGIVGNQVGSGRGNTAATVIGAAGGAYVGHEIEKRPRQKADAHRLNIRMEDGSYQSVTQSAESDIRVGDRVQVDNGYAQRY